MPHDFPFDPARVFGYAGELLAVERLTSGHINSTYKLKFAGAADLVLQKINTAVFSDVDGLMDNIFAVTEHIDARLKESGGDHERGCLHFLRTADGEKYHRDEEGGCWRAYRFVADSYTLQRINTPLDLTRAGEAFGHFGKLLADFDGGRLNETLPDFHNTAVRFGQLLQAASGADPIRLANAKNALEYAARNEGRYTRLTAMLEHGELPLRVTHNDTKLNNVVFDCATNNALCVIDLDTVMPGLSAYDFGDAIRFGANSAAEDERDLSRVSLELELFEAYAGGYLAQAGESLTPAERDVLAFGAWIMTVECGMRFFADYLNGDIYFHTAYPEHNLVRARVQFALAQDMENKMPQMEQIIRKL
ncbi:MAG: aminoglycoside phosphotransferase family protein [Clostridium sp.]|jgi:hypothetical protein|nr:aminoglycoside phosphotransferase family protein [Clostridium sp.]